LDCLDYFGLVVGGEDDGLGLVHRVTTPSGKQYFQLSPGSMVWITGCPSCSQWARACRFFDASQHPTSPQARHARR
jgi:hypothetical protein